MRTICSLVKALPMEDYFSFSPKKVNKLVCRDSVPFTFWNKVQLRRNHQILIQVYSLRFVVCAELGDKRVTLPFKMNQWDVISIFDVDLSLACQTAEAHLVQPTLFDRKFVQSNANTIIMDNHTIIIFKHIISSVCSPTSS